MSPLTVLLGVDIARRADLDIHFWLRAALGFVAVLGLLFVLDWFLTRSGRPRTTGPGGGRRGLIRRVSIPMPPNAPARNRAPRFPSRVRPRVRPRDPAAPSAPA